MPPAPPKPRLLLSHPWFSAPELLGSLRRQTFCRLAANSGPGHPPGPEGGEVGRKGRGGNRPPAGSGEGHGPTPTGSQSRPSRCLPVGRRSELLSGRSLRCALCSNRTVRGAPGRGQRYAIKAGRRWGGWCGPAAPAPPPPRKAQIKKQQKAPHHRREAWRGWRRAQREAPRLSRQPARAGHGWEAGPGLGEQGPAAGSCWAPAPDPVLANVTAAAAAAAAAGSTGSAAAAASNGSTAMAPASTGSAAAATANGSDTAAASNGSAAAPPSAATALCASAGAPLPPPRPPLPPQPLPPLLLPRQQGQEL